MCTAEEEVCRVQNKIFCFKNKDTSCFIVVSFIWKIRISDLNNSVEA